MLSPQIREFVQRAQQNEGFDLTKLPEGTFIEIETEHDTFYLAVVDPERGRVALRSTHPRLQKPQFFYHQGATGGGSVVKMGWVGIGLHMRMHPAGGGLMTTAPVKGFKLVNDDPRAKELIAAAEANEPKETITEEEFNRKLDGFVSVGFPPENQEEIRHVVGEFNTEGKGVMLGILERAHEVGKLAEALAILTEDFEEHWNFRPKHFRGSFITEQDVYYVERAYQKLGIPLPIQE